MAFLAPYFQPVATALATYFGITTTTTSIATALTPVITAAATKTAEIGTIYLGGKILHWQCEDAYEFIEKHCNSSTDSVSCFAMKAKEITACTGSWVASGTAFYEIVKLLPWNKK